MADDYYDLLGVSRSATDEDLRKAYFNLARKYHPDKNPDDPTAKANFQRIQKAYETLNDPKKRKLYDQFGPAWEQMSGGGASGGGGSPWGSGDWGSSGGAGAQEFDLGELFGSGGFGSIFEQFRRGGGAGGNAPAGKTRGGSRSRDVRQEVAVPLKSVVLGDELTLQVADGTKTKELKLRIPVGLEDGQELRLRGQGVVGRNGAAGDLLITVKVQEHPVFRRHGKDLEFDLPITFGEAVNGAKVEFPAPRGTVAVRIPPGTSSGAKLRVKGQGIVVKGGDPGDLFAVVKIVLPKQLNEDAKALAEQFEKAHPLQPRRELFW